MAQPRYHNCIICNNGTANHMSMNCPYGSKLSHGTKVSNLSNISRVGLLPSSTGRLGGGLYLTTPDTAKVIAAYKGQENWCMCYSLYSKSW